MMAQITDYRKFWERNREFTGMNGGRRVPVDLYLGNEWICEHLNLDCVRFYTDYRYQQDARRACTKITERELGYSFGPMIDFGVIMDASIYGGQPRFSETAPPVLTHAVEEPEEIDALIESVSASDPLKRGLIPQYFEWHSRIHDDHGVALGYGAAIKGCATMMGQILGITNFLTWIITDPEPIRRLIDCWYDTSVRYLDAMRQATGVTLSVGWFGLYSDLTGMLSAGLYEEFIKDKEKALYERYAAAPNAVRFYHADYHMLHQLAALKDIGVNRVNIDPYIDCRAILNVMPDVTIIGQIPPTDILLYGTPGQVRQVVKRDIEQAAPTGNLILSTAGGINAGTNFENLRAVCEAAEEFGYV